MTLAVVPLALLLARPALAPAQDKPSAPPKPQLAFEVATVKLEDPNKTRPEEVRVYPGGRLVIHGHDLSTLVSEAFNLPGWQVTGGEGWVSKTRFDIEGKPPEEFRNSVPAGEFAWFGIHDPQVRQMLQSLLIERFHLKYHMETQPGTVYLLKRSNGPLRLQQIDTHLYKREDDGSITPSNSSPTGQIGVVSGAPLSVFQISMPQLANMLGGDRQASVVDATELPGFYNFKSATVVTDEDFKSGVPSHLFVEALPEMGLKLVKTQGTVEKLIIDSASQPTAN